MSIIVIIVLFTALSLMQLLILYAGLNKRDLICIVLGTVGFFSSGFCICGMVLGRLDIDYSNNEGILLALAVFLGIVVMPMVMFMLFLSNSLPTSQNKNTENDDGKDERIGLDTTHEASDETLSEVEQQAYDAYSDDSENEEEF